MMARDLRSGDWVTRDQWDEVAYLVTFADDVVVVLQYEERLLAYPQPFGWIRVPGVDDEATA